MTFDIDTLETHSVTATVCENAALLRRRGPFILPVTIRCGGAGNAAPVSPRYPPCFGPFSRRRFAPCSPRASHRLAAIAPLASPAPASPRTGIRTAVRGRGDTTAGSRAGATVAASGSVLRTTVRLPLPRSQ